MEKRITGWYPKRKILEYLDKRIERNIILDDISDLAEMQRCIVENSLSVAAKVYIYRTRKDDIFTDRHIEEVLDIEGLRIDVLKLRSLLCDYTRTKHSRWFSRLFYREYSQRLAHCISEKFLEEFPRTSQNKLNYYVNDTNRKLYTELVIDIVFDVLLTPLVTYYDTPFSRAKK